MTTTHSAGGPLAGYIWQLHRALLALLDADFGDEVQIEISDDIAIVRHGEIVTASQAKHSLEEGTLTIKSTEWWKTLRVWINLTAQGQLLPDTQLVLCSTQHLSAEFDKLLASKVRNGLADALTM